MHDGFASRPHHYMIHGSCCLPARLFAHQITGTRVFATLHSTPIPAGSQAGRLSNNTGARVLSCCGHERSLMGLWAAYCTLRTHV
jgi:hypothetical protein